MVLFARHAPRNAMNAPPPDWLDLGPVSDFQAPLQEVLLGKTRLAVSYVGGEFGVVSGTCNHVGGPLGKGALDGEYLVCPWHQWKFHRLTGIGEPGSEDDAVPSHAHEIRDGHLWVDLVPATPRKVKPHKKHPLERGLEREPGPLRVVGISTTAMDAQHPRYSTSDALLETALGEAAAEGAETKLIRLNDLRFRACEGFYSKAAPACTWPCSITQMHKDDEMDQVYEAVVFWADVIIVATPIRWGGASSLYYKMVERMNCIQNQITLRNRVLMRNKVTTLIITGGQDNIQAVAGQMLTFFSELGCQFPQFPFIAHSRGWSAEDMEQNVAYVKKSHELHAGAKALVHRAMALADNLVEHVHAEPKTERRGRKASGLIEHRADARQPA